MTRRIITTSRPMDYTHNLQPMSLEDRRFWRLRRELVEEKSPGLWQRIFGRVK